MDAAGYKILCDIQKGLNDSFRRQWKWQQEDLAKARESGDVKLLGDIKWNIEQFRDHVARCPNHDSIARVISTGENIYLPASIVAERREYLTFANELLSSL